MSDGEGKKENSNWKIVCITWQWCSLGRGCQSPCRREACSDWRPAESRQVLAGCAPAPRCRRVGRCRVAWVWCRRCGGRRPNVWGRARKPVASRASSLRGWRKQPPSGCGSRRVCTRWPSDRCWKWAAGCDCDCTESGHCGGGGDGFHHCRRRPIPNARGHHRRDGRKVSAPLLACWLLLLPLLLPRPLQLPDDPSTSPDDSRLAFLTIRPAKLALHRPYRRVDRLC